MTSVLKRVHGAGSAGACRETSDIPLGMNRCPAGYMATGR